MTRQSVLAAVLAVLACQGWAVAARASPASSAPPVAASASAAPLSAASADRPGDGRAAAPAVLPPEIPVRRETAGAEAGGLDRSAPVVLTLGAVALLAWWGLWRLRRVGRASTGAAWGRWLGASSQGELVAGAVLRLTPRHSIHVVQWNGQRLLVGCSEHSVSLLAERPQTGTATDLGAASASPAQGVAATTAQAGAA